MQRFKKACKDFKNRKKFERLRAGHSPVSPLIAILRQLQNIDADFPRISSLLADSLGIRDFEKKKSQIDLQ